MILLAHYIGGKTRIKEIIESVRLKDAGGLDRTMCKTDI